MPAVRVFTYDFYDEPEVYSPFLFAISAAAAYFTISDTKSFIQIVTGVCALLLARCLTTYLNEEESFCSTLLNEFHLDVPPPGPGLFMSRGTQSVSQN